MGLTAKQKALKAARAAEAAQIDGGIGEDLRADRGEIDGGNWGETRKNPAHLRRDRDDPPENLRADLRKIDADLGRDHRRAAVIHAAADLCRYLSETQPLPRLHLLRIVRLLGPDLARDVLSEALRIERDGGELVTSGLRYRTPGGTFFRLCRELLTAEEWARVTAGETTTTGQVTTP